MKFFYSQLSLFDYLIVYHDLFLYLPYKEICLLFYYDTLFLREKKSEENQYEGCSKRFANAWLP